MPKDPIKSRTLYYEVIRADRGNSVRLLDWCTVDTELGPMVEQRQDLINAAFGQLASVDPIDASYTRIVEGSSDTFLSSYGTYGYVGIPHIYL